jgi:glycosyltransferase involved in cell wall biosynthesis
MTARSLRLLFLTERYPPHYLGGYEMACHATAERMRARGHEVLVLTSTFGVGAGVAEGHVRRLLHRPQDTASLVRFARWESADNRELRRTIARFRPDVIYVWCIRQLFPSLHATLRASGVPVVFNIQDSWIPHQLADAEKYRDLWRKPGSNPAKGLAKAVVRGLYGLGHPTRMRPITWDDVDTRRIVFCSRFRLDQHVASGWPLGEGRVIYNGIDRARFAGAPGRADDGELKVLFVGRLVHEKGPHTVVEAVEKLVRRGVRDVRLSVAGVLTYPREYGEELFRRLESDELRAVARYLGSVPNEDLPEVYRRHDVLVFASTGPEGLPVTLLEAMSCGIAVVSTTTGGSAEVVSDGVTGLAFPPGDSDALAECLLRIRREPGLAASLAEGGQALVRERFDLDAIASETAEYLAAVAH